jgi:hypothetical protein
MTGATPVHKLLEEQERRYARREAKHSSQINYDEFGTPVPLRNEDAARDESQPVGRSEQTKPEQDPFSQDGA